ncbi:MAG: hypothetical protein ACFNJR_01945, partial [Segatella oulorum]
QQQTSIFNVFYKNIAHDEERHALAALLLGGFSALCPFRRGFCRVFASCVLGDCSACCATWSVQIGGGAV